MPTERDKKEQDILLQRGLDQPIVIKTEVYGMTKDSAPIVVHPGCDAFLSINGQFVGKVDTDRKDYLDYGSICPKSPLTKIFKSKPIDVTLVEVRWTSTDFRMFGYPYHTHDGMLISANIWGRYDFMSPGYRDYGEVRATIETYGNKHQPSMQGYTDRTVTTINCSEYTNLVVKFIDMKMKRLVPELVNEDADYIGTEALNLVVAEISNSGFLAEKHLCLKEVEMEIETDSMARRKKRWNLQNSIRVENDMLVAELSSKRIRSQAKVEAERFELENEIELLKNQMKLREQKSELELKEMAIQLKDLEARLNAEAERARLEAEGKKECIAISLKYQEDVHDLTRTVKIEEGE